MSYQYPTNNKLRKPCPGCGRSMQAVWPICLTCKARLPEPLQRSLMGGWTNRNNNGGGTYYKNVMDEALAYLRSLTTPAAQSRIEADRVRLAGVCGEILNGGGG